MTPDESLQLFLLGSIEWTQVNLDWIVPDVSGLFVFFFRSSGHILAEAHGSDGEAKGLSEVSAGLQRDVSQREQLEVLKLQHRLPRSSRVLLPGLHTHTTHNTHTHTSFQAHDRCITHTCA